MSEKTLKPCPFCGGEAMVVEGRDGESAYVQCVMMKMHRAIWVDGDNNAANDAADEWNRRDYDLEGMPARVQARYDELKRAGKHGHYETLIQIVREEVSRARSPS